MVTLKQLNYAVQVAETRHFKKASERCFVSQSTLSTAIHELESQLGLKLFERDNKKVLITPMGAQVIERAKTILTQVADMEALTKTRTQPLSQPLSLGIIPTIGPYLLPKALPSLRESYPDLELTLVEAQSSELVDQVRHGQLDAAILALPYPTDGLLTFPFHEENFVALCHRDHPMAQMNQVPIDAFDETNLLLLSEGHCLTDHALAVCQLPRPKKDKAFEGTSLFTLVQMVAGKMGTTLIPEMALDSFLPGNPELRAASLAENGPHRQIAFIVRPNYPGLADIEALKHSFISALSPQLKVRIGL